MRVCSDLRLLHPLVRQKALAVSSRLEEEGLNFGLFETFRDPLRQVIKYGQGRIYPGKVVTRVPIGYHCFGLAVDFVLCDPVTKRFSGEYSWKMEGNEDKWTRLGEISKEAGFFWGGDWTNPDYPHMQLTDGISINNILFKEEVPYESMEYDLPKFDEYKRFLRVATDYSRKLLRSVNNNIDWFMEGFE